VHIAYAGSRAGSAAVSLLQLPVPEAACCALSGLHITSKLVLPLRLRYPFVHSMVWSHLVLCSIAPRLGMLLRPLCVPGLGLIGMCGRFLIRRHRQLSGLWRRPGLATQQMAQRSQQRLRMDQ
jgi:hypothetical protein